MKEELNSYNIERIKNSLTPIDCGIGIHKGNLMLGIIGEKERFEGTVISDTVNLASRLEGLTKYYGAGIIISQAIYQSINDTSKYMIRELDKVKVKGKKDAISIYEILDGSPSEIIDLKLKTLDDFKKAYNLYLSKDFNNALVIFSDILKINPNDLACKMFLKRCETLNIFGVTDNWDGSEEFGEK
ncbi:MAG TPA: adenylate/guanylate cyclase domain-containing protein [Spirochaetota bacterium]|nr:adenylate/guanylate cyclase domain-containing protein [Spirochaetota bacterium]